VVLDPFNGSGTTGQVALQHGRCYLGIELNPEYGELTRARLQGVVDGQAAADMPSPQTDLFAAA
jgi:DNA modification methylase